MLIDGHQLAELVMDAQIGVSTSDAIRILKQDEDDFEALEASEHGVAIERQRYETRKPTGRRGSINVSLDDTIIDQDRMPIVTVSPKFQVVIPREIREALGLQPGQKVQALQYQNWVEFIPVQSMRKMRGFLKGIDTTITRDADRV